MEATLQADWSVSLLTPKATIDIYQLEKECLWKHDGDEKPQFLLDSLLDRRWRSVLGFPLSVWQGSGAGTVGALAARSLEKFSQSIGFYVHFF